MQQENKEEVKNLPPKIYLQIGEDYTTNDFNDFYLSEITCCSDKVNGNDISYILESTAQEELAALQSENKRLKDLLIGEVEFRLKQEYFSMPGMPEVSVHEYIGHHLKQYCEQNKIEL